MLHNERYLEAHSEFLSKLISSNSIECIATEGYVWDGTPVFDLRGNYFSDLVSRFRGKLDIADIEVRRSFSMESLVKDFLALFSYLFLPVLNLPLKSPFDRASMLVGAPAILAMLRQGRDAGNFYLPTPLQAFEDAAHELYGVPRTDEELELYWKEVPGDPF